MKTRGKVLRPPNGQPGLLIIDGQQYRFSLDGMWKDAIFPKPGLTVEVEMNQGLEIIAITAVADSTPPPERAEARLQKRSGIPSNPLARIGARDLIALGLLAAGWFMLTTIAVAPPGEGPVNLTFWQVLRLVNSRNPLDWMVRGSLPSAGLYGLLTLLALGGTLVHHFCRQRIAALGGAAPLLLMMVVSTTARSDFQSAFRAYGDVGKLAQAETTQAVSLGLGAYLSGLMSLYFAVVAVREFLAPPAVAAPEEELKTSRAAA
ncbi:MAG TPA: hypothetical protein VJV74_10705 [Terriglobia bacterium]|nr:hypothetical protein [Terriglobia bacterium]